jgi:hypothetical protein
MALDFPSYKDIEHDFVAVFTADKSNDTIIDVIAIPYKNEGVMQKPIMLGESEVLSLIYNDLYKVFNRKIKG